MGQPKKVIALCGATEAPSYEAQNQCFVRPSSWLKERLTSEIGRGEMSVSHDSHESAIDLFRDAVVVASVPGFHVEHRDSLSCGDDRR